MASNYNGYQVPDATDPPDGPADFRRFADSMGMAVRAITTTRTIDTDARFQVPIGWFPGWSAFTGGVIQPVADPDPAYIAFGAECEARNSGTILVGRIMRIRPGGAPLVTQAPAGTHYSVQVMAWGT